VNKRVYEAVRERAAGACECCGRSLLIPELDHFEGRARSESIETCWMLTRDCHVSKSANDPSAAVWLTRFALHCRRYGYLEALERTLTRLHSVTTRDALGGN
jgi:hypothetical protein